MNEQISILEYIWRNCYQLVAWEECHIQNEFPDIFGCGFFIKNENNLWFITETM